MQYWTKLVSIVLTAGITALVMAGQSPAAEGSSSLGKKVEGFALRDYRGKDYSLADFKEQKLLVVAFLGTECPLANMYVPRLTALAARYADRGVAFIGINANQQDSISEIAHHTKTYEIAFPMLKDVGNIVADLVEAARTPEVFVLDESRTIRYRGRINDQYGVGYKRAKAAREDLATALDELLAGDAVSRPLTEVRGCHIGRIRAPQDCDVTYSNQIARIFQDHCVECHRPGEIAPFSLTAYSEVAGWGESIAEVVKEQRMPPWHADPRYGHFINDWRLSDEEKDQIQRWVSAGAPEGDPADLPEPREFAEGWRIPKPDREIFIADKPFEVPAEGEVRYQYFVADPGFTEDMWVQAAECRPGNRSVVHHIIVFAYPPGGDRKRHGDVASDWLVATAPGARPLMLREGMAKYIAAGSKLVFQVHYTPNGTAQSDRSSVGLVFADAKKVKKEVGTWRAADNDFVIPPHADNHVVEAWHTFDKASLLLTLFPHTHLRGKSFRYELEYPDGTSEVLLDVPRYDFNWQNTYELAEPKTLPAGTKLHCTASYDNSEANLANPNPDIAVRWGEQTWEEMMIGYFDATPAEQDLTKQAPKTRTERFLQKVAQGPIALDETLQSLAATAIASHEDFEKFAEALSLIVPQLDRVCLTTIGDEKLRIDRTAHCAELKDLDRGRGVEFAVAKLALAGYAQGDKVMVHANLAELSTPDFQLMGKAFSSSMHVPVRAVDRPATMNFWSREPKGFPPEAVAILEEAARLAAPK